MMYDAIKSFPAQFSFEPVVENKEKLGRYERFVVLGMGGSHLAADLIAAWKPELPLVVHAGYGLPYIAAGDEKKILVIASSYSGNTEETIDGFEEAGRRGIARAAIAVGGKLRELARSEGVPFVQFPDTGIQPRSSIGFGIKALLMLMGETEALAKIGSLAERLARRMDECEKAGKTLAEQMRGYVPVIYASDRNRAVAYNWKIKFNETGKIPAFYNVFPELNHNEMTGFDCTDTTRMLSERMFFVFVEDSADHPKVQKRMAITKELYSVRKMKVASITMTGGDIFEKMFSSTLTADWAALYTAKLYGVEADAVPMVEEFKKRIA
ncbi:MAG: bifunctional phosphoglucose/phosphomannose isomerase [Candidatus Sungbacteria bacterium RIFCSPHIGHO2_02_FULL_52_23]|uniref:Bifunctional phosphoglucose/phosphomannose isomerase n=1 Tax=Candidatus Sungbacteria bacterium RIFCSPHIGHO2_02_FULL_52_23 TaxID=1802274 RepID=A0A1G2KTY0_9BACT|nr:MAG: bifunctional phosphoglucose/phosphomannose isomerase [Candidatus Sungbacteria bacterium RIFCSPHIGHO2_02_FULL_52_23]